MAVDPGAGTGVTLRSFTAVDRDAVLELVNADRLPGRPAVTAAMLDSAAAGRQPGRSAVPPGLEGLRTEVLLSAGGEVLGAVCHATRVEDGAAVLVWLHCRDDDQALAQALINHTLVQLGRRTVHAFTESTAMSLAGLPFRNRPGTRRALEASGFSGRDQQRYLHHRLDTLSPRLYVLADLTERPDAPGWYLHLRERDGTCIGQAVIGPPVEDTVMLEWITLAPGRQRLGHILFEQCLTNLADRGIREVTTCLDAPNSGQPARDAVLQLHEAAGFHEIDQLHTFSRRP
ncbi:GNAT family N-acetyltransferase [Streptomyces sp. NPDC002659]|uniref:GNAT family N-acetyltransferase n=1 Tax=Streptomyces sp. NPDC002659 TaxID=3364656 RepID=UPI0036745F70